MLVCVHPDQELNREQTANNGQVSKGGYSPCLVAVSGIGVTGGWHGPQAAVPSSPGAVMT